MEKWNYYNALVLLKMKECYCAANRKGRKLKEQAKPIPEKNITY
jgi:hypothetical protein